MAAAQTQDYIYVEAGTGAYGDATQLYVVPRSRQADADEIADMSDSDITAWGADEANTPDEDGYLTVLIPVRVRGAETVTEAERSLAEALAMHGDQYEAVIDRW